MAIVFLLAMVLPAAHAGEYWKQKESRFSATAGETLVTGDTVCIKSSDGEAYKADANDSDLRPAVGVIGKGGASDATVEIVQKGILAGQTSASPGARLFLSETAGAMTTTGPTNAQILGWVLPTPGSTNSSTIYFIDVQPEPSAGAGF
jgi:hypothetical protein